MLNADSNESKECFEGRRDEGGDANKDSDHDPESRMAALNRELHHRLQELETLLSVLPVAIGIAQDSECHEIRVNRAFAEMLGITIAQNASMTAPDADRPTTFRCQDLTGREIPGDQLPMQRAAKEGTDIREVEVDVVRDDGRTLRLLEYAAPLFDVNGKSRGAVGVFVDLTQRQSLLESERAARAEAERAGRMKDEFLATLSHELRTPLNAILGYATLLRMPGISDSEMREAAETIERNARVQAQLIEDLLDMNRIISGKIRLDIRPTYLAEVVEAALETVRPSAEAKQLRIDLVLNPFAGPVHGDPSRLQQVIWNLLSNAIKFTPQRGRIQVSLERLESRVEIEVTDSGKGIDPEFLPYVFDRFRQGDSTSTRNYGGLGIGLSIVKHLVELHGGTVRASSPGVNRGATFSISLPLAPSARSEAETSADSASAFEDAAEFPDLQGIRVLAVDDEADACQLVKRILDRCGADVTVALSASEALERLAASPFDVLVSDIGMPHEDGLLLMRRVRGSADAQVSGIPALALTAFARSEDRRRAALAGFQSHLAKPVEPSELIAIVASLVGRTGTQGSSSVELQAGLSGHSSHE